MRYRINISYDGAGYSGWQIQPKHPTVQEELEKALETLTGSRPRVHSSGRTDRGVHARAQSAHFDLEQPVFTDKLRAGLNALLDDDIRVMSLKAVKADFHARYDVTRKEYRYFIWNDRIVPPFVRRYRTAVVEPLDVEAMRAAARKLEGRHDFAAFSANPNREVDGTVRELYELTVRKTGREIVIIAAGNGFLYKMVRSLAGFLIRVGKGELTPEQTREILDSRIRTATVPTAPPDGLFLWKVRY